MTQTEDATTQGERAPYLLAHWWKRAAAFAIDGGMHVALVLCGSAVGLEVVFQVVAAVFTIWNLAIRMGMTGQSIGKQLLKIELVSMRDAKPIGPLAAVTRSFLHVFDSVLLIGYLRPLWDERRQTFADQLLKTVVIESPRRLMR